MSYSMLLSLVPKKVTKESFPKSEPALMIVQRACRDFSPWKNHRRIGSCAFGLKSERTSRVLPAHAAGDFGCSRTKDVKALQVSLLAYRIRLHCARGIDKLFNSSQNHQLHLTAWRLCLLDNLQPRFAPLFVLSPSRFNQ